MKELNFKKGDIVRVNSNHCYINYIRFIWKHLQYAIRWSYNCLPNEKYKYKIRGIYKHNLTERYDENRYVVVVECVETKQIFLMGESSITEKLGE